MKTKTEIDKRKKRYGKKNPGAEATLNSEHPFYEFGNRGKGRPKKELCFTDKLRYQINKKKRFRKADGSILEASEMDLIVLKVVQELRTTTPLNIPLLNAVLNRLEGKPPETIITVDETQREVTQLTDDELGNIASQGRRGATQETGSS